MTTQHIRQALTDFRIEVDPPPAGEFGAGDSGAPYTANYLYGQISATEGPALTERFVEYVNGAVVPRRVYHGFEPITKTIRCWRFSPQMYTLLGKNIALETYQALKQGGGAGYDRLAFDLHGHVQGVDPGTVGPQSENILSLVLYITRIDIKGYEVAAEGTPTTKYYMSIDTENCFISTGGEDDLASLRDASNNLYGSRNAALGLGA